MNIKSRSKYKSKFQKVVITFFILLLLAFLAMVYEFHGRIYQPNIALLENTEEYIYIPTGSDFDDVIGLLSQKDILVNINSFVWVARQKKYNDNIKSGRYKISNRLNNNELINLLRSGDQVPVRITFNNIRNKEDFAATIAKQLEIDSTSILNYILDTNFLNQFNKDHAFINKLDIHSVVCLFIPNTYEFYWDVSLEDFFKRMIYEYQVFWNQSRREKAKNKKISIIDVSILASIVEKEQSIKLDERPMIAGLYLNRIRKNMKLESDPTLIFAIGDFSINRVLNKDKKIESVFNTYKNKGLPPGPICLPSINAIDAVLNAANHSYVFMCAKEDFSGYHNFAITYKQHLRNARKYQRELNNRRIMR